MNAWITSTKNELLKAETENINSRLHQWERIVNDCTKNEYTSAFKSESTDLINLPSYKPLITDTEMNKFLLLILNWNGINTRNSCDPSKLPSTYKDYQLKAKNQINGSRAKHYSRTLYPYMIDCAETYANNISQMLFININVNINNDNYEKDSNYRNIQEQCASLFYDILIYSYLVQLCQCRLRVTKQGRRVYLLCDNSLIGHKSNTTTKMFQKYANDHPYIEQFPSHREEAIDHFNKQKENTYKQLFILYQKRKTYQIINNNKINKNNNVITYGKDILNIMQFIKQHSTTNDKKRVNIHKDTFNIIMDLISKLQTQKNQNNEAISDLQNYIATMENDNLIQMQKEQQQQQQHVPKNAFDVNVINDNCNGCDACNCNGYNNNIVSNQFESEKPLYKPTEFYSNDHGFDTCDLPPNTPTITNIGSFGSIQNFNMSYIGQHNYPNAEFNDNSHSTQTTMFHEFECDSVIMNSTPICAPMSVDNNLLYTQNENQNDEYIHNKYDNFNDIQFNYDNLDYSSTI